MSVHAWLDCPYLNPINRNLELEFVLYFKRFIFYFVQFVQQSDSQFTPNSIIFSVSTGGLYRRSKCYFGQQRGIKRWRRISPLRTEIRSMCQLMINMNKIYRCLKKKCGFFPQFQDPTPLPLKCGKFLEICQSKRVNNRQKVPKTPFFHTFLKFGTFYFFLWRLPLLYSNFSV